MISCVGNASLFANETSPEEWRNTRAQWMVSMVFSSISAVVIFYIVIALSYFAWRTRACSLRNCVLDRTENASPNSTPGSTVLLILTLIVALSLLIYFLAELPLVRCQQAPFCAFYHRITTACGVVTFGCVYFALWFRVYSVFYRHHLIKRGSSRFVRVLSKVTVVFLAAMLIINSATFFTAPPYRTTAVGCKKAPDPNHTATKWGLLVASTVVFQGTLLGLFVYPLIMHRKNMLHNGFDSNVVMPIIKRAFITAAVCIVSDTLNAVYAITNKQDLTYVRHTVYGFNLIINLIALICSSTDWKQRLFPLWKFRLHKSQVSQNSVSKSRISNVRTISQNCGS